MKSTSLKLVLSKRLLTALVVGGMAVWAGNVARAANVLFNANLDQIGDTTQANPCPIGWVVTANKAVSGSFTDGGDSETFCNVSPPSSPTGYGFFFKPFQGTTKGEDVITVNLYQDNSSTPGTGYTLSGYASCEQNFCGLFDTNSPAPGFLFYVAFLNSAGDVIASNTYNLVANGLPTGGPASMAQLTTPQYTAPSGTVTVRAGALLANAYGTTGAQNCFVDSFDLESIAAAGSPNITNQPTQVSVSPGGTAQFSVGLSNPTGATYQWQLNDAPVVGSEFSGANTATLTITGVTTNDVGHYRVLVSNGSGSVFSAEVPLTIVNVTVNPVITINGKTGDTYEVDYTTNLNTPSWIPLSTNKLAAPTLQVVDPTSALSGKRFYRAVFLF